MDGNGALESEAQFFQHDLVRATAPAELHRPDHRLVAQWLAERVELGDPIPQPCPFPVRGDQLQVDEAGDLVRVQIRCESGFARRSHRFVEDHRIVHVCVVVNRLRYLAQVASAVFRLRRALGKVPGGRNDDDACHQQCNDSPPMLSTDQPARDGVDSERDQDGRGGGSEGEVAGAVYRRDERISG